MSKKFFRQEKQANNKKAIQSFIDSMTLWFAICCWAGAYVAARFLLHPQIAEKVPLSPIMLAALRFCIASLFFLVPLVHAVRRREISCRQLLQMAILGLITFTLYYWLQYIGIEETNASIASILGIALIPIFTAILVQAFKLELLSAALMSGLLLGLLGVVLIVLQQPLSVSWQSGFFLGAICLIINTFSFAVYTVLSKQWVQDIPPIVLTGGTMMSGAIGLLLLSFLVPTANQWSRIPQLSIAQWIALLFLSLGCSVLAYTAYTRALSRMDASRVTSYFYAEPLIAVLLSVLLLGERLTWQIVVGGIVIGAALLITNSVQEKKTPL